MYDSLVSPAVSRSTDIMYNIKDLINVQSRLMLETNDLLSANHLPLPLHDRSLAVQQGAQIRFEPEQRGNRLSECMCTRGRSSLVWGLIVSVLSLSLSLTGTHNFSLSKYWYRSSRYSVHVSFYFFFHSPLPH